MMYRFSFGLAVLAALFPLSLAEAAELPPIKTSEKNAVPACATPGRFNAFLKSKNSSLDPRFEQIAVEYMRKGEQLGLRWDYAFVQMTIETGYLSFKRDGGRRGDVKPSQNNFAGLGATGNGASGESFPDLPTGVLAHLQHIQHYAGEEVKDPVAERTRKVQEWGVLKNFHKKIKGPVTFAHLAGKWATSSDYDDAIQSHADRFFTEFCTKPDPQPELVAVARGETKVAAADKAPEKPEKKGAEIARRAIEDGKAESNNRATGLGAASLAKSGAEATQPERAAGGPAFTILNAPKGAAIALPDTTDKVADAEDEETTAKPSPVPRKAKRRGRGKDRSDRIAKADSRGKAETAEQAEPATKTDRPATFATASAAGSMAKLAPTPPAAASDPKCRVLTASYGGQKAMIIRATDATGIAFTVLDVNEGAEKREAEAYISAYARGGEVAGEFSSQTQALDKAFELCPEG